MPKFEVNIGTAGDGFVLTSDEAKALAAWAEAVTTAWGPKFDAALAVAQRVSKTIRKPKKPTRRGQPPKAEWKR